jgi:hypothetical protein
MKNENKKILPPKKDENTSGVPFQISRYCKNIIKNKNKIKFISKQNFIFLSFLCISSFIFSLPIGDPFKWVGMTLCIFSSILNDSVQTLGTFLSSNSKTKWYKLFFFIASLFLLLTFYTWFSSGGYLDSGKLSAVPYNPEHTAFHFLAPILLIFLTYNKIPVSTTFLIFSVFASQKTIGGMLLTTFVGYIVGIILSYSVWSFLLVKFTNKLFTESNAPIFKIIQWATSGILFMSWAIIGTANMVIFVPRDFDIYSLILFLFLSLGVIAFAIYNRGGPIQELVDEKCNMDNLKTTSITNILYASIILGLVELSPVSFSTTWVFIGLLAGQEMALAPATLGIKMSLKEKFLSAQKLITKDIILATIGLILSLLFAMVNSIYYTN